MVGIPYPYFIGTILGIPISHLSNLVHVVATAIYNTQVLNAIIGVISVGMIYFLCTHITIVITPYKAIGIVLFSVYNDLSPTPCVEPSSHIAYLNPLLRHCPAQNA
jgi:hypothetical protein